MARTELSIEPWRPPGKLIHIGSATTFCMGLGQTDRGYTEKPVGENGRVQFASAGTRTDRAIGGNRLRNRESICRNSPGEDVLIDIVDRAIRYQEQHLFVSVCSNHDINFRASPGNNAVNWASG